MQATRNTTQAMNRGAQPRKSIRGATIIATLLLAAWGCSDGQGVGVTGSSSNGSSASIIQPSKVNVISGNGQSATVGMPVSNPLVVKVTNAGGAGINGLNVVWTIIEGGGTLSTATTVTDASGVTSLDNWTLGTTAGANKVSAAVPGLQAAVFTAQGEPDNPASLSLSPPSFSLQVGKSEHLEARAQDAYGNSILDGISWSSSDISVASVDGEGVVTALTAGTTIITASVAGMMATSELNVATGTPMGILRVKGQNQKGEAGTSLSKPLVVEVRDASGSPIPGIDVEWAVTQGGGKLIPLSSASSFTTSGQAASPQQPSADRNITTQTNGDGQSGVIWVLGNTNGTNTVTAGVAGAGSTVFVATSEAGAPTSVTISPSATSLTVGQAKTLLAVARDNNGNPVQTQVSWSSSDAGVASVHPSTGYVVANGVGSAIISATADGAMGSAAVNVITQTPTAMVAVAGNNQSGTVGNTLADPLEIEVRDANGAPVSGVTVEWAVTEKDGTLNVTTSNTDASGRAKALWTLCTHAGENGARASVAGLSPADFVATGEPGPVTVLAVDPEAASVSVNETADLDAMARDAFGNPIGASVSWTSLTPTIASVDGAGRVTGKASGTARIEASVAEATATAEVNVAGENPASLGKISGDGQVGGAGTVLPAPLAIRVLSSSGAPLQGIAVQWEVTQGGGSVSRNSGLTDANGEAQVDWTLGSAPGTGKVTATVSGLQAETFTATTTAGPVANIVVSPDQATIIAGKTVSYAAAAKDEFGNTVNTSFSWDSSDESVAMIGSSTGVATGLRAGAVIITALAGGVSGSAALTVNSVPLPSAVSDLAVAATTTTTATLSFTEVNDGSGRPAAYQIRFFDGNGDWGTATPVTSGTCAGTLTGTAIGGAISCSVEGLLSGTSYGFMARSQRADGDVTVFGSISNVAEGATDGGDPALPARIQAVSGDQQTGTVGSALTSPLVLEVQNGAGTPLSGVTVDWAASKGTLSASSSSTDAEGRAQVEWTLATTPGQGQVVATVAGGLSKTLTATAKVGAVASIVVSPDAASIEVGQATAFGAVAKDSYGNVVASEITWSSAVDTIAAPVNPPGTFFGVTTGNTSVKASAGTITGNASISVLPTAEPTIQLASGDNQSGEAGSTLPNALVVQIMDGQGNPASGMSVAWAVTRGGGSLSASSTTTNSQGLTQVNWTLGTVGETNMVSATASGVGTVSFSANATSSPAEGAFFFTDFESDRPGSKPSGDGVFSWGVSDGGTSVTDEWAMTGSKSLRFRIPKSSEPGVNYNNEIRFSLGRKVTEIWIEYYLYYPDGTEGIPGVERYRHGEDPNSSDNDKFFRIWGGSYSNRNKIGFSTRPLPDPDDSNIFPEYAKDGGGLGTYGLGSEDFVTDAVRGQWIQVRLHFRLDTGSGDGQIHLWIDGAPVIGHSGLYVGPLTNRFWDAGYFFGAANSGSPNPSAIYMDDLQFFATDPGW